MRISQFLDRRSPGDCVQFFYQTQKLDEFAVVRRKMTLKKRRMQVRSEAAPPRLLPAVAVLSRCAAVRSGCALCVSVLCSQPLMQQPCLPSLQHSAQLVRLVRSTIAMLLEREHRAPPGCIKRAKSASRRTALGKTVRGCAPRHSGVRVLAAKASGSSCSPWSAAWRAPAWQSDPQGPEHSSRRTGWGRCRRSRGRGSRRSWGRTGALALPWPPPPPPPPQLQVAPESLLRNSPLSDLILSHGLL